MVKDNWVYCPICHNKTRTKIRKDTVAVRLPIFCPKCKNTSVMDIKKGEAYRSEAKELKPDGMRYVHEIGPFYNIQKGGEEPF